jgi:hypothetical protein
MGIEGWNEYERLLEHLKTLEPGSDEFDKTLDQINKIIHVMKQFPLRPAKSWLEKFIDNPALVNATAMVLVAFVTLYHERLEIVTSRVFGFVRFK